MARLRRFFSRPTYANVMSTIAVFAVLSGGYAVAFSGSGSLQKAKLTGIGTSFETVRSLTGIGSITAVCSTGPVSVGVRFQNSSGQALYNRTDYGTDYSDDGGHVTLVPNGGFDTFGLAAPNTAEELRLHLYPAAPDDKAPQADIAVGIRLDVASCADSEVAVLALNTQQ